MTVPWMLSFEQKWFHLWGDITSQWWYSHINAKLDLSLLSWPITASAGCQIKLGPASVLKDFEFLTMSENKVSWPKKWDEVNFKGSCLFSLQLKELLVGWQWQPPIPVELDQSLWKGWQLLFISQVYIKSWNNNNSNKLKSNLIQIIIVLY